MNNQHDDRIRQLVGEARKFEAAGDVGGALRVYRKALDMSQPGVGLHSELKQIVSQIEQGLVSRSARGASDFHSDDLDMLFDEGMQAYRRGELAEAEEFFAEVVRRKPNHVRNSELALNWLQAVRDRRG